MKIELERTLLADDHTLGVMTIDGAFFSHTIEDRVRDYNKDGDLLDAGETKIFGETAIPYGTYEVDLTMSPKFKRLLPWVKDVPHFTGIRIHRGNDAGDSHGCIIPGQSVGNGKVVNSTDHEMKLIEHILAAMVRGEKITLEIA